MSSAWIKKLNEDNGRLHKEDVLRQALEAATLGSEVSQRFLEGLKVCYNTYDTFGVKQIPDSSGISGAENPWVDFHYLLERLRHRTITGNAAKDAIQDISCRFDSDEWNLFLAPILRRDMRSGISTATINKIVKGTEYEIPVFSCQLATSCDGRPEMTGIKRLEPKLDGVRVLMAVNFLDSGEVSVVSYSRNGKIFYNFEHIEEQIQMHAKKMRPLLPGGASFVLDGEIVSKSFQELMRQVQRKENVQNTDSVFHVFDIIPVRNFLEGHWNARLSTRLDILKSMQQFLNLMNNVELLPHKIVDLDTDAGQAEFHQYCSDMVAAGFEGVMIKNLDAPYICDRSTYWMKYKPTITVDLTIIGLVGGTGKNSGKLGALVCSGNDHGKEITVNVGSGFDDKFRAQAWANYINAPVTWTKKTKGVATVVTENPTGKSCIGDAVEILADAITQNQDGTYSLRFPRFYRFRNDK